MFKVIRVKGYKVIVNDIVVVKLSWEKIIWKVIYREEISLSSITVNSDHEDYFSCNRVKTTKPSTDVAVKDAITQNLVNCSNSYKLLAQSN